MAADARTWRAVISVRMAWAYGSLSQGVVSSSPPSTKTVTSPV